MHGSVVPYQVLTVSSESGIVVLAPATTSLPAGLDQEALLRELGPLARSGQIFFLMTDDPIRYRIEVLVNEALPAGLDREFEPLGGSFRLEAASEKVVLIGWNKRGEPHEAGSVAVRPGVQLLSVYGRRPFDSKRYSEDMTTLLGADAKFMQVVDRLGLIGCLPRSSSRSRSFSPGGDGSGISFPCSRYPGCPTWR